MTNDMKPVRLACVDGPDLHFTGRVLHEFTTQNRDESKSRWSELRIWETAGGRWVAEVVGCSTVGSEREIRHAAALDAGDERGAMEVWGWSIAAKAFARQLGWRGHIEEVE